MATFQVQLWPDGKWDGKPYRRVEAPTAKEAAEKLYGRLLNEDGSNYQIRAQVRRMAYRSGNSIVFYEV